MKSSPRSIRTIQRYRHVISTVLKCAVVHKIRTSTINWMLPWTCPLSDVKLNRNQISNKSILWFVKSCVMKKLIRWAFGCTGARTERFKYIQKWYFLKMVWFVFTTQYVLRAWGNVGSGQAEIHKLNSQMQPSDQVKVRYILILLVVGFLWVEVSSRTYYDIHG